MTIQKKTKPSDSNTAFAKKQPIELIGSFDEVFKTYVRSLPTGILPIVLMGRTTKAPAEKYNLQRDGISQSMLHEYMECPYAFMFNAQRWHRSCEKQTTYFGSLFHEVLAHFIEFPASVLRIDRDALSLKIIDDYLLKSPMSLPSDELETRKGLTIALISAYLDHYAEDFKKWKPVEVEQTFDVMYKGRFRLRGKIDAIIEKPDGSIWKEEHKTSSRINEDVKCTTLSMDLQNQFYTFVKKRLLGLPVVGTIYNVNRVPQLRKGKTESVSEFVTRVREDIAKRPEWYFYRFEVIYTDRDLDRFEIELTSWLEEIEQTVEGFRIPIRRNICSCDNKMYPCEYIAMCASGQTNGYKQVPSLFTEL